MAYEGRVDYPHRMPLAANFHFGALAGGHRQAGQRDGFAHRRCKAPAGDLTFADALHAHRLTFPHPVTKQPVTVESPLPPDITAYIEGL